jgi:phage gp45-like
MIRAIVISVIEGVIKIFTATGRKDAVGGLEQFDQREYLQHYGFTSRPKAGAELIIVREGNHLVAIASDDRRYRLHIAEGEAALYDDQGQVVVLKRGKEILVDGCDTLVANAAVSMTLTSPTITLRASTKVLLDTPLVQATGEIEDHVRTMSGDRSIYNGHHHANSTTPTEQM